MATLDFALEEHSISVRRLGALLRHPPETLFELIAGRDAVLLKIGPRRILAVNHPRLVEELFVQDDARGRLAGFAESTASRLGGTSVPGLEGEAHRRRREVLEQLFRRTAVAPWTDLIARCADDVAEGWSHGVVVDAEAEMERATVEAVATMVFGPDYEAERAPLSEYYDVSRKAVFRVINPFSPVLWRLPLPLTRRFMRAQARFNTVVDAMVAARRRDGARDSLLARLVPLLSGVEARDEAWTYYSQSAPIHALAWTWWLLGTHPEVEARLHGELDVVLGGRLPTADDLDRLTYARAVLLEAVRVYPPGWAIVRPMGVGRTIAGRLLPSGTILLLSPWVLHRDERFWPAPDVFEPERWLDERVEAASPHAYVAFGAGPRRCPARPLAEVLCTTLLATIARRWRLRPVRQNVQLAYVPFLRPKGGLPVTVERRDAAP